MRGQRQTQHEPQDQQPDVIGIIHRRQPRSSGRHGIDRGILPAAHTAKGATIKIAIIGAGNVGRSLGTAWHNRGHDVTFGVRNPDDPRHASLGTVRANEAAASDAEVVVLYTPWQGTQDAEQGCGDLSGKDLIEATNPLSPVRRGLGTDFGSGLLRGRA
ncbi:MAG TPA: NAD(P)-binding domain-containing protein [Mycobacterium sp.]|nr:NAD(P)-binding domain-containing protein [Mycobacterium sp.]